MHRFENRLVKGFIFPFLLYRIYDRTLTPHVNLKGNNDWFLFCGFPYFPEFSPCPKVARFNDTKSMIHQFKFPEVEGLAQQDMKLLRYYVAEQQKVNEGDPIAFVDLGIATVDVPAEKEGIVKTLHVPVGGIFQCGEPVYTLITYSESESTRSVTRWEYKTIPVKETGLFGENGLDTAALKSKLDALGREGWELVTGIDTQIVGEKSGGMVLVLKRRTWQ